MTHPKSSKRTIWVVFNKNDYSSICFICLKEETLDLLASHN